MIKYLIIASIVILWGFFFFATRGCGCSTKEMSYQAAMKSDLRNVVTAQEAYHRDDSTYTASLQALKFTPSTGVRVEVFDATREGFRAVTVHRQIYGRCEVYVGQVPQVPVIEGTTLTDGEPRCTRRTKRYR